MIINTPTSQFNISIEGSIQLNPWFLDPDEDNPASRAKQKAAKIDGILSEIATTMIGLGSQNWDIGAEEDVEQEDNPTIVWISGCFPSDDSFEGIAKAKQTIETLAGKEWAQDDKGEMDIDAEVLKEGEANWLYESGESDCTKLVK